MTMRNKSFVAALALLAAQPVAAQLPNPSAASVGMAGTYTALARGLSSMHWNPAGLAMPGSSGFAISILPLRGVAGMDPVTLEDIAQYDDGTLIPEDVRREWVDEIFEEGSQQGSGGVGITWLALSIGRFGFQAGSMTAASTDIPPGIARLLLLGNADGDTAITLDGSVFGGGEMSMTATTTFAVSYAHPLTVTLGPLPDQHFALGATVKYTIGNAIVSGETADATVSADPFQVAIEFPLVTSFNPDSQSEFSDFTNAGSGIGLDIGAAWQGGIFYGAVSLQNLINTFEWNEDELWYVPGEVSMDNDTTTQDTSNFVAQPFANAPDLLRDRLDDLALPPTAAIAAAVRLPMVIVSGEVRIRTGESVSLSEKTHFGLGAEFRPIGFLPIRAGVASVDGGYNLGAGLGLEFGVFNLNVAANRRATDLGTDVVGALSISFGGI